MNDVALLQDYARTGSEAAFAELVSRHINLVYSAALRQLSDPELARDVAQMVFADLARKAGRISRRVPLAGWLYRSTTFAAAKVRRTEQRRLRREQEASVMHNPMSEPEAEWERLRPLLDECLAALGEKDRTIVLLRFFERMNLKQTGQTLGLSEDAAQKRVSRALEKMRLFLTARGVTVSAVSLSGLLLTNSIQAAPHGLAATLAAASFAEASSATSFGLIMNLISSSKMKAAVVSIILASVVAAPLVLQRRAVKRLTAENEALLAQLSQSRMEFDGQLNSLTDENALLKRDNSELLALRGELAGLKRDAMMAAKVQTQASQGTIPAGQQTNVSQAFPSFASKGEAWRIGQVRAKMLSDAPPAPAELAWLVEQKRTVEQYVLRADQFGIFQASFIASILGIEDDNTVWALRRILEEAHDYERKHGLAMFRRPEVVQRYEARQPDAMIEQRTRRDQLERNTAHAVEALLSESQRERFRRALPNVLSIDLGTTLEREDLYVLPEFSGLTPREIALAAPKRPGNRGAVMFAPAKGVDPKVFEEILSTPLGQQRKAP